MNEDTATAIVWTFAIIVIIVGLIGLTMWVLPTYGVWQQGLAGEASLARADQDRQIALREAEVAAESAQFLAQAEVARARGVAEANAIIADGLGGPEGYLRYLYIDGLRSGAMAQSQIIYIPTEAGLPILEAGRLDSR